MTGRASAEDPAAGPRAALGLLQDITAASTGAHSRDVLVQACVSSVVERLDISLARIWLHDEDAGVLDLRASAGLHTHLDGAHGRIAVGSLKVGRIASTRRPYFTNDLVHDQAITDVEWVHRHGLVAFAGYPLLLGKSVLGVLGVFASRPLEQESVAALGAVADALAVGLQRLFNDEALRLEAEHVRTLYDVGTTVSALHRTEAVVQEVTDAATRLAGAQFGAFFYNMLDERGEDRPSYAIAGVPREAFSQFPHPRHSAILAPTFDREEVVRLDDVTLDPRYGRNEPHHGTPPGHLPVRSYLAVPVASATGEMLGGLFFGHESPGVFDAGDERMVVGIAGHAAAALDAVRLFDSEHRMALELQRTLLPRHLPPLPGAEAAARYLPASDLARVGGDWYDVTNLPDGTVAITVGDVAGHDLQASATMGRLRHAVQLYALDGCRPAEALARTDRFMRRAGITQTATVVHSAYDPVTRALTLCRAGHPSPLVVRADGSTRWPEPTAYGGRLLGAGRCEDRSTIEIKLEVGDTVVFFTDGLVERPNEYFDLGIERLAAVATAGCDRTVDDLCHHLLTELVDPDIRDDVVVMVLRVI